MVESNANPTINRKAVNVEHFIAKRLSGKQNGSKNLSKPFALISTVAIGLSLAIMIIGISVLTGFKREISQKTIGFASHIQIVNFDGNTSFETNPISNNQDFLPQIQAIDGVEHIQQFAVKPGILKTGTDIHGVVLKGIASDFDWSFIKKSLVEGSIIELNDSTASNQIIISQNIASLLKLKVGDKVDMYFVQQPPRVRRFTVNGIYNTQMGELDNLFVIGDLRHIRSINGWNDDQITGFEIFIDDFDNLEDLTLAVDDIAGLRFFEDGSKLRVYNIIDKYPQTFDWLGLQNLNLIILILLMLIVAGINMISALLIMILERTNMIGVLKALGAGNGIVRKIFMYQSAYIIGKGLFWGNVVGVALCYIQHRYGVIGLDPENYYLDTVPININLLHIALLNLGTFAVTLAMLVVPSMIISRISPEKTIKFD